MVAYFLPKTPQMVVQAPFECEQRIMRERWIFASAHATLARSSAIAKAAFAPVLDDNHTGSTT